MSIHITAYEIECTDCGADLGRHHEFVALPTETGTVVLSFFGVIHACDGTTEEDVAAAKEATQWGPWSPDRRAEKQLA